MIDPNNISTIRIGELSPQPFSLTDKLPHEIGTDLTQGTVQQLADVIGAYLGTTSGLAFNPTTVVDGGTLPATASNEWMLLGKGTFHNVGGGTDIITTEELNAVTSNGSYWILSVQIPINVELAGITQQIRSGFTTTAPSEDKLFQQFSLYTKTADIPPQIQLNTIDYPLLVSPTTIFNTPLGSKAKSVYVNQAKWFILSGNNATKLFTYTVSGNVVTLKSPGAPAGSLVSIDYE